jgi:type II secretory pathway pseudopilin PulG
MATITRRSERRSQRSSRRLSDRRLADQRGYTYIGLLFVVALTGGALAAAGTLWRVQAQREREADLLFTGRQFAAAIARYYERTPVGQPQRFPARLEELLEDRRWPAAPRHLRRLFIDPMTGRAEWGTVLAPDGRIMGVYSLSPQAPIKRAGFGWPYEGFSEAATYQDWRFVYVQPGGAGN